MMFSEKLNSFLNELENEKNTPQEKKFISLARTYVKIISGNEKNTEERANYMKEYLDRTNKVNLKLNVTPTQKKFNKKK